MRALLFALVLPILGCDTKPVAKGEPAPSTRVADDDKATEAEQARGAAKTEAANVKEAADSDAAKAHKATHAQLQSDFDASDRKFNALREQAAKATGAKKTSADAAVAEVTTREAVAMANIAKLRDATGAQWDAMKTQVDADAVALDKAIAALASALQ